MEFDQTDPKSIETYVRRLLKKRLADFGITEEQLHQTEKDKGMFGKILEEHYLKISPGNKPCIPDFPEAGLELKSTKLIPKRDGKLGAGERMKLSSLNYDLMKEEGEWDDSCAYKKNRRLLIVGHVYQSIVHDIYETVELVSLWEFPQEDLPIIRNDWDYIRRMIREGKEDQLSERDTDYIGASTAGAGGQSDKKRKTRAISMKMGYVNAVIRKLLHGDKYKRESIVRGGRQPGKGEGLETFVLRMFQPHIGKELNVLISEFGIEANPNAKSYHATVARYIANAILGLRANRNDSDPVDEFEKAEIMLKTVRLRPSGVPEQHLMLRPAFEYKKIIQEKWDESELKQKLGQRILFVVFQESENGTMRLSNVFFWTMPEKTLESDVKWCWEETVRRIHGHKIAELPKVSENEVCHVRPIARDKNDTYEAHDGKKYTKKGFWLRNTYIAEIIRDHRA